MGRRMRYSRPKTSPPETLLDFLCARFPYLSRDAWVEHMEAGHLSVNTGGVESVTTTKEYVLRQNDEIHFNPPRELEPAVDEHICVVHEDDSILVCIKNGNLPVAEGGRYSGNTLVGVLERRSAASVNGGGSVMLRGKSSCNGNNETETARAADGTPVLYHPVHRLDKETSGLVVLAKEINAARLLSTQFEQQSERLMEKMSHLTGSSSKSISAEAFNRVVVEEKAVTKSYIAVLAGAASEGAVFVICDRIGLLSEGLSEADITDVKNHQKLRKLKMACFSASVEENPQRYGRPACSHIHILSSDRALGLSVACVDIITGRTHQIRLHCAQIGFPVLGDKLYETTTPGVAGGCCAVADDIYIARARGNIGMTSAVVPQLRVKRHLLHATMLAFCHPISNKRLIFFADPREWIFRDVMENNDGKTSETTLSEDSLAIKSFQQLLDKAVSALNHSDAQFSTAFTTSTIAIEQR